MEDSWGFDVFRVVYPFAKVTCFYLYWWSRGCILCLTELVASIIAKHTMDTANTRSRCRWSDIENFVQVWGTYTLGAIKEAFLLFCHLSFLRLEWVLVVLTWFLETACLEMKVHRVAGPSSLVSFFNPKCDLFMLYIELRTIHCFSYRAYSLVFWGRKLGWYFQVSLRKCRIIPRLEVGHANSLSSRDARWWFLPI